MKRYNLKKGKLGEDVARKYLEDKGYIIIGQNYRNKYGEIDLIARDRNNLVFVEVKTRIGEQFGLPEDAINKDKIRRLIRNSQAYLTFNLDKDYKTLRIDAICIVIDQDKQVKRINHYQNITG